MELFSGILLLMAVVCIPPGTGWADSSDGGSIPSFTPNASLEFSIGSIGGQVKIDGKLDEAFWHQAARLSNFCEVEPGENIKPKVETEAYFAHDAEFLYMAFVCHDADVSAIRASICDRDRIFQDDFIGIMIDTFTDNQNGYEFFVNPHGIQGDLKRTSDNEDSSFDTIWESAGEINGRGWTAEVAIPFRSLRFPDSHEQTWNLHVLRVRPRDSREQISWAPLSRDENCLFCQAGKMTGLQGVNKGRNIELLPYVIGSQYGGMEDPDIQSSHFNNDNPNGDAGFGLKYGLTPNLTLDFTYNPDFSQIESDAAQIDVNTTFALSYPERRPFFLEGRDIFSTDINAVYTRSINDPIAAAKLTGKSGKYTIGYIFAQDDNSPLIVPFDDWSEGAAGGKSVSNIFRVKRDLLSDSFLGLMFTDRRLTSGSNSTFGLDGRLRFKENYILTAQALGNFTREPDDLALSNDFSYPDTTFDRGRHTSAFDGEDFTGTGIESTFRRSARHWNFNLFYADMSPTFRAENGSVFNNNYRNLSTWNGVTFQPNNRILDNFEPQFNWGIKHNHDGAFKDTWIQPSIWVRFKKQTGLWMGYMWSEERFKNVRISGISRLQGDINTNFSELISGGGSIRYGRSIARGEDIPFLGHERVYELWTTIKPTCQLRIVGEYTFAKMLEPNGSDEYYSGYVARVRLTYQFTQRLFLRMVSQYNDFADSFEFDPLLSYKINPFTVFFLGSTHDTRNYGHGLGYRQTDRQFFVKFQYLFRI
jgi:hypothetical protein